MSLSVSYSWTVDVAPDDLAEWVIYAATERDAKGQEVARARAGDRYATWVSDETLIFVRVLAVKRGGVEEPWDAVEPDEVLVQGRDVAKEPDPPASVAVGMVDLGQSGRVEVEPPTRGDPPAFVQVIQGADADTGKLLAEHKVLPSGPIGTDGAPRQLSVPIPMEGSGGTKSIVVRNMGTAGRPSSDVVRTVREQDDLPQFHEVAVCSWSGTTRVNIPAAGATDAHEFDATDGARARAKPTLAGATGGAAGWGTLSSGLLASGEFHGAYLRTMTVESDEVDLGATLTFRLTAVDAVGRKAAAGTSRPLYATKVPLVPAARQDVRLLPEGPAWAARETRLNGKPRQPIRSWRWEYVVGTSSPVAHASSDYKPLTPGQLLNGRYVRVRLVVTDPTGQHRIVCPSASVKAHVFRRTVVGAGSPESSVAAPPGSHYHRTDGPPHHYVKVTGVGNTGWLATNAGATVTAPTGTGFAHVTSGAYDAAAKLVESADVDAALKDPAAATAGLRTLGTSGTSACAGNDARLSDARAPDINGLTAETAVDRYADYVPVYDASATANRKMRVRDLAAGALVRSTTHYDVGPSDATEQTIFTGTVPANCMGTDRMLRLAIRGTAKNQTGSGRAFQIRLKFGGSTLVDCSITLASSATLTTFWVDVEIQNDAATNAQNVTLRATLPGGSAPATGTAGGSAGTGAIRTVEGTGTVDTTSDQTLAVTLQLPVSDVNLYADIERGMLELV